MIGKIVVVKIVNSFSVNDQFSYKQKTVKC